MLSVQSDGLTALEEELAGSLSVVVDERKRTLIGGMRWTCTAYTQSGERPEREERSHLPCPDTA